MKKYLALTVVIFICFADLKAQPESKFIKISSLQDAWSYALKNNPDQKTYILNIEKAKTDLRISESTLLPNIGGNFGGQINTKLATTAVPGELFGKPGQTMNVQFGQKYNYNAGVSISKTFLDLQNLIQIKLAKNEMLTTQLQAEAFQQNLKQQVALCYYSAIITQEALRLFKQNLALADSIVVLTNQKLKQGLINSITANQSIISRNNVKYQILTTETLYAQSLNSLKILFGMDVNTELKLDTIELKNQTLLASEPNTGKDKNLAIQENQLKSMEMKVNLQKTALLPKLSWNAYYGQQQLRNDFGMSFNSSNWHPVSYIGLNLQVPIFTGFANWNKVKSVKIQYQSVQNQFDDINRKSMLNDNLLMSEYKQSIQLLKPVSDNYQLFAQNRQLAEQQLKEGVISMDVYFKIFEDYLNAENSYLNALSVYYSNYSTIISRQ